MYFLNFLINLKLRFTGFLDYAGKQNTLVSNLLAKPKLLLDVGKLLNTIDNMLFFGFRFFYWHNKLGIKNLDEATIEPMLALVI